MLNLGGTAEDVFRPIGDGDVYFFADHTILILREEFRVQITKELVNYVAELSRIKLDEAAEAKMEKELGAVIEYMDVLNTLDTDGIEPMSHVFAIDNVMREDVVKESYDREALLANAPERTDETVVVPKTVD